MLGGVYEPTSILIRPQSESCFAMLKIGGPAVLLLLILGIYVRSTESGFADYRRGNFASALTDLTKKGGEGNAFAAYLVGQIYAGGKAGEPNIDLALKWYHKAASNGHIAASFAYLEKRLISTTQPLRICTDYAEIVKLSTRVQNIHAYLFLFEYYTHSICDVPDVMRAAYYSYYMHLAASLYRAFGPNKKLLVSQLSDKQRLIYEKLLKQEVVPITEKEFLTQFVRKNSHQ